MVEFTGERVIPGQVEPDLWNEHMARYAFAARRAAGRRALDAGCGSGYGTAALAGAGAAAIGVDVAAEALAWAREHFTARFVRASCSALPFADGAFDMIVAFEVIEHLEDWPAFLAEARRVLSPAGECIVSTPNRAYYAESRRRSGPNPYHVHEFDFDEFSASLRETFPCVTLYAQNHVEGIGFQPLAPGAAEAAVEDGVIDFPESHFLLAVCSAVPREPAPTFLYIPRTANILRERELHIEALEKELAQKDEWLEAAKQEKHKLVEMFQTQTAELEQSNRWAGELDVQLGAAKDRIVQVQRELAEQQAGYEAKIAELEQEHRKIAEWAFATERRLTAELEEKCRELAGRCDELSQAVRLLDQAEATVVERTEWAQRLDAELRQVQALLTAAQASRWVKLGRAFGLGPALGQR